MRAQTRLMAVVAVGVIIGFACGGAGTQQSVTPTGGEVCLPQRKVCIDVPAQALTKAVVLRIAAGVDAPPAALSEVFDISATPSQAVEFEKPAKVSISLDAVNSTDVPSENLLRIYTRDRDTQAWVALDAPAVDRVRREITGFTHHLSPFVVLRADRTPEGEVPTEIEQVRRDSGVIVLPPIPDAGRPVDAGRPDGGRPDSGTPDAGIPDAGAPDSGVVDGGVADSGVPVIDAGMPDASVDAGAPDAGPADSGAPDAGSADAGQPDAGQSVDGGDPDAGTACDGGGADGGC